mgnify:FL=1
MRILLFCSLLISFLYGISQNKNNLNEIATIIRSGNASQIAKFMDNSIEITIGESQKLYSKAQAEQVLERFFDKNNPKQFNLIHKSNVKEGKSKYGIGELITTSNKKFRTYFYVVLKNEKFLIRELNFEEN